MHCGGLQRIPAYAGEKKRRPNRDGESHCVRADARNTGIRSGMFDHVLIMGNSLGYLSRKNADFEIVSEAFRVLRPGGWLLIDVADGETVMKNFSPRAWHEVEDDMVVCRGREIVGDRICAREMVLSKKNGLIRDRKYAIRLYDRHRLAELFSRCGFESIECHGDFSPHQAKGDYGFMNHRILAVGRKKRTDVLKNQRFHGCVLKRGRPGDLDGRIDQIFAYCRQRVSNGRRFRLFQPTDLVPRRNKSDNGFAFPVRL